MSRILLILAFLVLAYLAWTAYVDSTPEGKRAIAEKACRTRAAAERDTQVMKMRAKECEKLFHEP